MNISLLAALADLLTAFGVLISLIFVIIELRRSNREQRLANWFNTTDRLYDLRGRMTDLALYDIVLRGRASFDNLTPVEAETYKQHLLRAQLVAAGFNRLGGSGLEGSGATNRAAQKIITEVWDHPAPRSWWEEIRHDPPVVPASAALIDKVLGYPPLERNV